MLDCRHHLVRVNCNNLIIFKCRLILLPVTTLVVICVKIRATETQWSRMYDWQKDHEGISLLLPYISHDINGQTHYRILEAVSETPCLIYCRRQDASLDTSGILSAKKCFVFSPEPAQMCIHATGICLLLWAEDFSVSAVPVGSPSCSVRTRHRLTEAASAHCRGICGSVLNSHLGTLAFSFNLIA